MLDSSDSSTTSTSITQLNCSPDSLHCCSGKQLPLVFTVLLMLMMQTHHGSYPEVQCEKRSVGAGGGWCNWAQFQAMQLNQVWNTPPKKTITHSQDTRIIISESRRQLAFAMLLHRPAIKRNLASFCVCLRWCGPYVGRCQASKDMYRRIVWRG